MNIGIRALTIDMPTFLGYQSLIIIDVVVDASTRVRESTHPIDFVSGVRTRVHSTTVSNAS